MIILLSPAKSLDYDIESFSGEATQPVFLKEAAYLTAKLKKFSAAKIGRMMSINPNLAGLNHQRYQEWEAPFTNENAKPAILVFRGDVYRGLSAGEFEEADLKFAQGQVRILSGLYGLLKPLDLMQPYRLEMGTRWAVTPSKSNLYKFWGNTITDEINTSEGSDVIINLASNEYFKAVNKKELKGRIITCHFRDLKNGEYKPLMTYAKLGRGYMTKFIVKNRITNPEDIKAFDLKNYMFNSSLSTENDWVFTRDVVEL